jgi:hypothetical protein
MGSNPLSSTKEYKRNHKGIVIIRKKIGLEESEKKSPLSKGGNVKREDSLRKSVRIRGEDEDSGFIVVVMFKANESKD